jgi:hypothetical protein
LKIKQCKFLSVVSLLRYRCARGQQPRLGADDTPGLVSSSEKHGVFCWDLSSSKKQAIFGGNSMRIRQNKPVFHPFTERPDGRGDSLERRLRTVRARCLTTVPRPAEPDLQKISHRALARGFIAA